jgi:hypothetical protein
MGEQDPSVPVFQLIVDILADLKLILFACHSATSPFQTLV